MARRRLTPAVPAGDVPRAERMGASGSDPFGRVPATQPAPIARVAAEAAGAAAAAELAETLRRARDEGRLVLDLALEDIAPDHLLRDRLPEEDAEMAALRESLRSHGQRTPIEVTPLGTRAGGGTLPYGLLSGWRRLMALKALQAETGEPRFATVRALVRRPETAAEAYVGMVEENEIRLGLSHYERARVAALATDRGVFPSEKRALLALFAGASRAKRSRIRAFLEIYRALDGVLRFPAHLPERLGLALVEKVRAGGRAEIVHALECCDPRTPEAERATLAATLAAKAAPAPASRERLRSDVTLAQTLRGQRLTLRLEGPGVTPEFATEARTALMALREASRFGE